VHQFRRRHRWLESLRFFPPAFALNGRGLELVRLPWRQGGWNENDAIRVLP
jgi:hypothetical protein